jgi:hypothetical protein
MRVGFAAAAGLTQDVEGPTPLGLLDTVSKSDSCPTSTERTQS